MIEKKYEISIEPKILELLGPSLYTNIYYILAELIANAYDAEAHNVYIIISDERIIVEDDGKGMSYLNGDIRAYLDVAKETRINNKDAMTKNLKRKRMGRKGVGKLAALSVSENVLVKTVSNGEKSGFILTRHVNSNRLLKSIPDKDIVFTKISNSGTAIIMDKPAYQLHNTFKSIKKNLLKIFPLVSNDFIIHIIKDKKEEIIDSFDKEMIGELSTLITLGDEFKYLNDYFKTDYEEHKDLLLNNNKTYNISISMKNKKGENKKYNVEINGWIGTYITTRGRKVELTDFPDNFISLYANKKLGEFNILPIVGQNKLDEAFVVGQLHIDIFELTELPDMALSNRQGYKTDDPRYKAVVESIRKDILPKVLNMKKFYVDLKNKDKQKAALKKQLRKEEEFKEKVEKFKKNTSEKVANRVCEKLHINQNSLDEVKEILIEEINANSPDLGIKSEIDSQKKKILISQTKQDKDLADTIYNMLLYNNVPSADIIYTNCDDEEARVPEESTGIYNYLRDFFVNSYSTQKIYVIFVTSENTKKSWGAVIEIGAAWITQIDNKIFNIKGFRPEHPLDDEQEWHTSCREQDGTLFMYKLDQDKFCTKIEYICKQLGYKTKTREENLKKLSSIVKIIE